MGNDAYQSLREKLELEQWPNVYMYKFIFEGDNKKIALLESEFDKKAEINIRSSSKGKYTSITIKEMAESAEAVIDKYKAISKIEGVIKL